MDMGMDGHGHQPHREQRPSIPVPHFTWLRTKYQAQLTWLVIDQTIKKSSSSLKLIWPALNMTCRPDLTTYQTNFEHDQQTRTINQPH